MASFPDLAKPDGLKALDEYLLTRSYITGYAIPSQRVFSTLVPLIMSQKF
jgi:hypothetical protein